MMKIEIRRNPPQKGAMARRLVCFCITVLTLTLIWAIAMKTAALMAGRGEPTDLTDVLTFAGTAFGGELMLLAFKRIFAKNTSYEEETP